MAHSQVRLGFCEHEIATDRNVWTKEAFEIFGLDTQAPQTGRTYLAAYCEVHGGSLVINSEPGQGTWATVHLPEARLLTGSRPATCAV
jgi:hypothetical protein